MIRYEEEYVLPALRAAAQHTDKLPPEVARAVLLAASLIETGGAATCDELAEELGTNWVLARRTKAIVARYGDNVRCYTNKGYDEAVRRALAKRADRLAVQFMQPPEPAHISPREVVILELLAALRNYKRATEQLLHDVDDTMQIKRRAKTRDTEAMSMEYQIMFDEARQQAERAIASAVKLQGE